jgi:hypothetical protein
VAFKNASNHISVFTLIGSDWTESNPESALEIVSTSLAVQGDNVYVSYTKSDYAACKSMVV